MQNDCFNDCYAGDFERMHYSCIPDSGEIQVNGLMVIVLTMSGRTKYKSKFSYVFATRFCYKNIICGSTLLNLKVETAHHV